MTAIHEVTITHLSPPWANLAQRHLDAIRMIAGQAASARYRRNLEPGWQTGKANPDYTRFWSLAVQHAELLVMAFLDHEACLHQSDYEARARIDELPQDARETHQDP